MKHQTVLACALALGLSACAQATPTPQVIIVTPTPRVVTATPLPPTLTPRPTPTRRPPTVTPMPTEPPVSMEKIYAALRADGYKRFPFTNSDGVAGFDWVKNNGYERIITWETGEVRLEVLDDKSPVVRNTHMEQKLKLLDDLFSPSFMTQLRQQHQSYNQTVGPSVSGSPEYLSGSDPNDTWGTIVGEYNVKDTSIHGFPVRFALWWWQSTCPPQYLYCYLVDFPGTQFTGDASLVFYSIYIDLRPSGGVPGGNA